MHRALGWLATVGTLGAVCAAGPTANPFSPLDPPTRPFAAVAATAPRALTPVLRPLLSRPTNVPAPASEAGPALAPAARWGLGLLITPQGRAVVEQGEQQWLLKPGDELTIEYGGPRRVKVVALDLDGVTLRDLVDGRELALARLRPGDAHRLGGVGRE